MDIQAGLIRLIAQSPAESYFITCCNPAQRAVKDAQSCQSVRTNLLATNIVQYLAFDSFGYQIIAQ